MNKTILKPYYEQDKLEVGIDEAGRGCLFGPVCVAGVIWNHEIDDSSVVIKDSKKLSENLERQILISDCQKLLKDIKIVSDISIISACVNASNQKLLRDMADFLRKEKDNCIVVLGSVINNRPALVTALSESLISKGFDASLIVRKTAHYIDGGGGGKKDIAQAGGKNANSLPKAIDKVPEIIQNILEN